MNSFGTYKTCVMVAVVLACSAHVAWGQGARVATPEQLKQMRGRELSRQLPPGWDRKLPPGRKMTEAHKARLYPSSQERTRYATFLRRPGTGLARLLALGECVENAQVIKAEDPCLADVPPVPGGGAFYSFARGVHQWGPLADLWLKGDNFLVGFGGGVLGAVTALGDVPLESVSPESPGAEYLTKFVPPSSVAGVDRQYELNKKGFQIAGFTYGMAARARPDTTYVLRSITYDDGDNMSGIRKPNDLLVALRVVGKTLDGSLTILWKELRRTRAPRLRT